MTRFAALLRAANVGDTGKRPMAQLRELCVCAKFTNIRTYIASGNAIFTSDLYENEVRVALGKQLEKCAGKPVGVLVRSVSEMADVISRNPFQDESGSRVIVLFTDDLLPKEALNGATGLGNENVQLGKRELFILYPNGQAGTRLRLPSMKAGTGRNINTVTKIAEIARAPG
jgi:uncharacterized protein (DUF1697 family)